MKNVESNRCVNGLFQKLLFVKKQLLLVIWAMSCFCLPLFADGVDMTEKIVNPDFTDNVEGWKTELYSIGSGNTFNYETGNNEQNAGKEGYWHFNGGNGIFSANESFGHENLVYQTITGLENGTYVFSAVSGLVRNGANYKDPFDYKNCVGVYFFANEASVQIQGFTATQFANYPWCHTEVYYIPVVVTNGTLTIGQRYEKGNNASYCSFERARLFYYGDATLEEAQMELCRFDIAVDCCVADTLTSHPMSKEKYEDIKYACSLGSSATNYEELKAVDSSIYTALAYGRRSLSAFKPLVDLVATAEEVMEQEWSDNVKEQVRLLGIAIAQVREDLASHAISESVFDEYMAGFENAVNRVRIDPLWNMLDELNRFIDAPGSVSEDNPCFGLTEHPGFGSETGQYAYEQYESLKKLHDAVGKVLHEIEEGELLAAEGFAYITRIENAVKLCITSANGVAIRLPYDYILDPDPNDPTQPYVLKTSAEIDAAQQNAHILESQYTTTFNGQNTTTIRYQTPYIQFDRDYDILTISVTHTHKDLFKAIDDGPVFILYELYILDANGNRMEIPAANITCNATSGGDGTPSSIFDGGYTNSPKSYFQSSTSGVRSRGYHTLTIVLPKLVNGAQFVFENIWSPSGVTNCPNGIRIDGMNKAKINLETAIETALASRPVWGTDPCYFSEGFDVFDKTLADAEAVLADSNATDGQVAAAVNALNELIGLNKTLTMVAPTDGQEYFITSRQAFMENQGVQKNLTVFMDSILWYDNANPSDPNQRWIFTRIASDDETDTASYYTIRNVGTGKYIGDFAKEGFEPTGEPIVWGNPYYVKLGDEAARFRLISLGQGQTLIQSYSASAASWCTMACQESNNGIGTDIPGECGKSELTYGIGYSIKGVRAVITNYNANAANTTSAYSILPAMYDLPCTVKAADVSDKRLWHFSTGGRTFTFTADKNCAFANFRLYDKTHTEVNISSNVNGNVLRVTVPLNMGDFYFTFDNNEGVQTIRIDAPVSETSGYEKLRKVYDGARFDYTEGTDVGCIKDLSAYTAAMTKAEELLADEDASVNLDAFAAASMAVEEAVAGLETVQPEAGKTYIIVSAYPKDRSGSGKVALSFNESTRQLGWNILDASNAAFHWQFEPSQIEGAWYLKNMCSQNYMYFAMNTSTVIGLSETPASYEVIGRDTSTVLVHCLEGEGPHPDWNLQARYVSVPSYASGELVFQPDNAGARWIIREVAGYTSVDVMDAVPAGSSETGIYDLAGRRVDKPVKGIYIVNGKKTLFK